MFIANKSWILAPVTGFFEGNKTEAESETGMEEALRKLPKFSTQAFNAFFKISLLRKWKLAANEAGSETNIHFSLAYQCGGSVRLTNLGAV